MRRRSRRAWWVGVEEGLPWCLSVCRDRWSMRDVDEAMEMRLDEGPFWEGRWRRLFAG